MTTPTPTPAQPANNQPQPQPRPELAHTNVKSTLWYFDHAKPKAANK